MAYNRLRQELADANLRPPPFRFAEAPLSYDRPPPLGQHTEEVLGELGIGATEIERLRKERVL